MAEVMAERGAGIPLHRIGMNDEYCTEVGSQEFLREEYGAVLRENNRVHIGQDKQVMETCR